MYKDRFKEGEFLNKIQYMYTGELVKIQFKFRGRSLEAILDRLPTANVILKCKFDEVYYGRINKIYRSK